MANRKLAMYEYRQIIYHLRKGQSARFIAKKKLAGRPKIKEIKGVAEQRGWLDEAVPLPDNKTLQEIFDKEIKQESKSNVLPYAALVEEQVKRGCTASVIYDMLVRDHGFTGAYNSVRRYVKKLKEKDYIKELTVILNFKVGEAVQVDFGKGPDLFDERVGKTIKTWFFVMTLCWSRHQYVEFVAKQDIETWLTCHKNAFNWFNGVANKVIIDNAKCAITRACYYDPEVTRSYESFAQEYGFIISACPPREPKKKGRVESGVKYVKRNFVPLMLSTSLQEANKEVKKWVIDKAGNRIHGTTFEKPLAQFVGIEQACLDPLPCGPVEIASWKKVSLQRNCHVQYKQCKYSAPHIFYKKELWLKATLTCISIYHEHQLVATHPRLFIPGSHSSKIEHYPPNASHYLKQDPQWCVEESKTIGAKCQFVIETLLSDPVRDLLHQAQSVLNLSNDFGVKRLEAACNRAVNFNVIDYKTIKKILKNGFDAEPLTSQDAFDELSDVYQGSGVFQRNTSETAH